MTLSTEHYFNTPVIYALVERIFNENFNPTLFTGIKKEQGTFFYSGEMHDYWEIVYVEKGKLTVAEDEKIYELSECQAIFHAPMEFHSFWAKSEDFPVKLKIFSFSIDTNLAHNLSKGVFTFDIDQADRFTDIFKLIKKHTQNIQELPHPSEINHIDKVRALKSLENFLLEIISDNSPDRTINAKAGAKRYQEVVRILKENVHERLTVEEISKLSHLSVTYIKKLFNLYAGCGVIQHFTKLKMAKAIKYLKEGYSVGEVADMLSFSSSNYFSSAFKKETGMSPGAYKQK